MFNSSWFAWTTARQHKDRTRPTQLPSVRRRGVQLACEQLEDRTVPSNFTAATVTDLITDIGLANHYGGSNTISLVAGNTFTLTARDNATDGGNGLPVIAANDNLTIQGNGDTIERSQAPGTWEFRLFDVAAGASLTLSNLTVQDGQVYGAGGGIYSSGSLSLEPGTLITNNEAAYPGEGGGVYVASGTATLTNAAVSGNAALGYTFDPFYYGPTGPGEGGGLYVAGGTVTLTNVTVSSNAAQGADKAAGEGGGLYVAGGTVTLTNSILSSNSARGGMNSYPTGFAGTGAGGALYVAGGTVTLTDDTLSSNSAVGGAGGSTYLAGGGYAGGGGVAVTAGTVTLTGDILSSNSAVGGAAGWDGPAGNAGGGGLAAGGGTVTLRNDTVTGNSVVGGPGWPGRNKKHSGQPGLAEGGGVYIGSTVYLDAFTVAHTTSNTPDDIYGSYILN
jgi:hypothetical protein